MLIKFPHGDIYFDTSKDLKYGAISNMVVDDDVTISRIEATKDKRNPKDFVLWKVCNEASNTALMLSLEKGDQAGILSVQ